MPRLWTGRPHGVRDPLGKDEELRSAASVTVRQITKETKMYTNGDKAVYADANGKVVPGDSPDAAFLVVAAGGTITDEQAAKYGLTGEGAKADPDAFHDNTLTEREVAHQRDVERQRAEARDAARADDEKVLKAAPAKAEKKG